MNFIKKYQPQNINTVIADEKIKNILASFIKIDMLKLLFVGDSGSGKTTFINVLLKEYYGDINYERNIFRINNLKEQGISIFRQEIRTFIQTSSHFYNKKKFVILDDIDNLNEQTQQIIRNCIDNYSDKVHFIASCNNLQKVLDTLQSRLSILRLSNPDNKKIMNLLNIIITNENICINRQCKEYLVKVSNNSFRILLNYLQKIVLLQEKNIDFNILKNICTHIKLDDFELYINYLKNNNMNMAYKILIEMYYNGYSVIDILENFFFYLKITNILNDKIKYSILPIITNYITIFHTIHEEYIELFFFTFDLYTKIFKNI